MESALFTHPTDSAAAILADARRADLSFADLAARHNTTPDALALWLATAEIAHIVETTDAMVCYRTRLIAADKTGHAIGACVHILEAFNKAAAIILRLTRLTRLTRTPGPTWVPRQSISAPSPQADADPRAQPKPPQQAHTIEEKHERIHAQPHRHQPEHKHSGEHSRTLEREHERALQPYASALESDVSNLRSEIPMPRPLPFPAKQLWRNTPGAATARAP